MFLRIFSFLCALSLFCFALMKVLVNSWGGRRISEDSNQNKQSSTSQNFEPLRWLSGKRVSALRRRFPDLKRELKRGEIFALKHKIRNEEECTVGLFRVEKFSDDVVIFESFESKSQSRLQIFANAMNDNVEWIWQAVAEQTSTSAQSLMCKAWIRLSAAEKRGPQIVKGRRFFISGSQFSEVVNVNHANARIEGDKIRRGWWISPKEGYSFVSVGLRRAATGFVERHFLQFAPDQKVSKKDKNEKKKGEKFKSFVLPGWD